MDAWKIDLWLKNQSETQFINYDGTLQMKDGKAVKQVVLTPEETNAVRSRLGMPAIN